jgi:DNA ligase (NAD+)
MNSIYEKIRFLVNYLNDCTKEYDKGTPIISDKEWDEKYFELQSLEEQSGLILSNSPTQSISYKVVSQLNKKEHNHKMLSLDKTKDVSVVNGFINKKEFLAMCKMDGLTCSLTYENGELVAAETRGNGLIGEDILHNIKTLVSVPKKIPHLDKIIIDGEIICKFNDFEEFSQDYKNPRNFAAGSIRLLDSKECSKRKLTFVVWDIISSLYDNDNNEMTVSQKLEYISPFGFTIVSFI